MRHLLISACVLLATACSQPYGADPAGPATPQNADDVFGSQGDDASYVTASYEVLRATLTDVLGVVPTDLPDACQGLADPASMCPVADPVAFLDANRIALGTPVYEADGPLSTEAPGMLTSGGVKVWVLSASSACGLMMQQQDPPSLFPEGLTEYEPLYRILLGRAPTVQEQTLLSQLAASPLLADDVRRGAA